MVLQLCVLLSDEFVKLYELLRNEDNPFGEVRLYNINIYNKVLLREMGENSLKLMSLDELIDRFLSELEIDERIEREQLLK